MASWVSAATQYEAEFVGQRWVLWAQHHADLPVYAIALYLPMIFVLPNSITKPFALRLPRALWNLSLSIFSIIGVTRTVPHLLYHLSEHGFMYTVCANPLDWYADGPVGLWMGLFIYSKIPELVDTLFLVLQKKPVIFLHWFHHTTVLLYCWHAFLMRIAPGLWFAAMNYSVHSIMYFYYFLMSTPYRSLKGIAKKAAPLITTLQLTQMLVGMYVTFKSAYTHMSGTECFVDPANYRLGMAMYCSYAILFGILFYNLYLRPAPAKPTQTKKGGAEGSKQRTTDASTRKTSDTSSLCGVDLKGADASGFFHTNSGTRMSPKKTSPKKDK